MAFLDIDLQVLLKPTIRGHLFLLQSKNVFVHNLEFCKDTP